MGPVRPLAPKQEYMPCFVGKLPDPGIAGAAPMSDTMQGMNFEAIVSFGSILK